MPRSWGRGEKGGNLLVLESQVLEEMCFTSFPPQSLMHMLRFLPMCPFGGYISLFHLWFIVKFLSQNRTQDSHPGSPWPILWDILLRHNWFSFLWPPMSMVREEVCRSPLLSSPSKFSAAIWAPRHYLWSRLHNCPLRPDNFSAVIVIISFLFSVNPTLSPGDTFQCIG